MEIETKTWKTNEKIKVEKIEECDKIWNGRPWTLNGSQLIIKRWEHDQAINEISFIESTFILQIHGLPPVFVHEEKAKKIETNIGRIHQETLNKKCVVENRFLRLKIEMEVIKPILACFFQERKYGEDRWIQFKYERWHTSVTNVEPWIM